MNTHQRPLRLLAPLLIVAALLLAGAGPAPAAARRAPLPQAAAADQLIVTLAPTASTSALRADGAEQVASVLSADAGTELAYVRPFADGAHIFALGGVRPADEVAAIMARLAASPEVLSVEPDVIFSPALEPSDPFYQDLDKRLWLWHLKAVAGDNYGANLPPAWDITTGAPAIVTAIVDTGARLTHEDLAGRTPADNPGYDMVFSAFRANDGDGRDGDPTDPGDYVNAGEGCAAHASTWHGSHVAGTIGARANNGKGIAGVVWDAPILHVRALGKCGGSLSDIADGIRWAAGLNVPGVPLNPNPARVINLSLGARTTCDGSMQDAVNAATAAGSLVVVAAGNDGFDASGSTPGNCDKVLTVAATTRGGDRASYSNFGSLVELAGPGGDSNGGVFSTIDSGEQGPVGDAYDSYVGTSMATPHVSGIAALMLSANPGLTPAQLISIMQSTATPFPPGSSCAGLCGAGIVNAGAAVEEAARRVRTASFGRATTSAGEGATVSIPIALSIAGGQAVAVPFTLGGTAGAGDTNLVAGNIIFPAGTKSASLDVTLTDDTIGEGTETLVITIGTGDRSAPGATKTHTISILDNDARPLLALAPAALAFGDQRAATASPARTVTISSAGDLPLTVSALSLSADFVRAGGSCPSSTPFSMGAGASCTLEISFRPALAGAVAGALTVSSNGGAQTVALGGRGVIPALGFGPTVVNFPAQAVGTTSATQTVTLTNPGTAPLVVSDISASGDYALGATPCAATLPATLAPGASCALQVAFAPLAGGLREGGLAITSDAVGGPYSIPLRGQGLASQLALDAVSLSLGGQQAGGAFGLQNLVVAGTPYTVSLSFDVTRAEPLDGAASEGYLVIADRELANGDLVVADAAASFAAGAGVRRVTLTLDRLAIYGATQLVVSLDDPGGGAAPVASSSVAIPAGLLRTWLPLIQR